MRPRPQVLAEPVDRARDLDLLQRAGRVHALRADLGACADERALPDAGVARDFLLALVPTVVARIEVVAVRERYRGGADEGRLQRVLGACGVAEHAVDAHRVAAVSR